MPTDVTVETPIRRPRAEVARFMFDPANDTRWTTGIVACRPLTPGPLRTGSRVRRTARFLGREFEYEYRVTDADPDRSVDMEVDRPFPMRIRYELEDARGGTLARIRARGDATGFFRLAGPLLNLMVRRNISGDLRSLKRCLEA